MSDQSRPLRVLVAVSDPEVAHRISDLLRTLGYEVHPCKPGPQTLEKLRLEGGELVIYEVEGEGPKFIGLLKEAAPFVPVLGLAGRRRRVRMVMEALRAGADDVLSPRVIRKRLKRAIDEALAKHTCRRMGADEAGGMKHLLRVEAPSKSDFILPLVRRVATLAVMGGFVLYDLDSDVKVAITEAITNAMEHGNKWNEAKVVVVEATASPRELKVVVTDQGEGFDASRLPDPTSAEQLSHHRGRGVFLMRSFMDEVRFNDRGNQVTLIKRR